MPAPVILFDLDGTLADTAPDLTRALNHVLRGLGIAEVETDALRHIVGHGARRLIEQALAAHGQVPDEAGMKALVACFIDHYADNIAVESRPFPGVPETLARLKGAGARLAVCTNKFEHLSHRLLDAIGLDRYFDFVAGSDTFPVRKPDPGHLLLTLEKVSGDPGAAVMVGDSAVDVAAARAAGLPVVGVSFGYTDTPIADLAPDAVIDRFEALIPVLERWLGRLDG